MVGMHKTTKGRPEERPSILVGGRLHEVSLDGFSRWYVGHYRLGSHVTHGSPGELKRITFRKVVCFYNHGPGAFTQAVPATN